MLINVIAVAADAGVVAAVVDFLRQLDLSAV